MQHHFWFTCLHSLQTLIPKTFRDLTCLWWWCPISQAPTTICCSSGREIVVVLSQGFVVKRSISSSERKSSLRLRSHAQDEFSATWKFKRLGVLLTWNHLNRMKVLVAVQSFVWKEQNYWTIPSEWSVKFFSRCKIRPKMDCTWKLAPPCTHTACAHTN